MSTNPGAHDARTALLGASTARERLAGRSRWMTLYFALFAAASFAMVVTVGLGGLLGVTVATPAFLVVVGLLVAWAMRQGVFGAGWGRLHVTVFVVWGVLWLATAIIGMYLFQGEPAFWLPVAVVDAAPFLVGALASSRTASPR